MDDKYISIDAAIETALDYRVDILENEYDKGYQTAIQDIVKGINAIPAADVVSRDCFNRILAENDTMREQLAAIGKKPGDSMEDVEIVKIGHWIEEDGVQICSECGEEHEWLDYRASVCDCCGARMKARETDA